MGGEGEGVGNDVYVPTGHMAGSHIGAVEWSSVWSIYRKLAGADRLCPRVLEREDDNKVSLDTQPAATVDTPASPDFRDIFLVEPPIHLEGRSVECMEFVLHRLIAITSIVHHRSCQMLGKNNPGRDYSSFRAGRRPSNFCLEKLRLKSLLPSLPPVSTKILTPSNPGYKFDLREKVGSNHSTWFGFEEESIANGRYLSCPRSLIESLGCAMVRGNMSSGRNEDRSWTSGTGAGGCEWEARPAGRSSVLSSRKVVQLDQLDGLAHFAGVGNDGYVPTGHMAGSHIGAVEWSSVWSLYRKLAGADRLCPRVLGCSVRNCQKPPGTSRQCPSLSGISSLLRGRDFMATVGAVCNIHTNKMCLTLIDKNIFYDPSVKMTMRCLEFILHRLIAITCIIHHRSCQMLGKNNPGRDYSSFRAGRRPSNFCLEKLQLKSLLPSLPPVSTKILTPLIHGTNLTLEKRSVRIIDRMEKTTRKKTIQMVKVIWNCIGLQETTWETDVRMKAEFPKWFEQFAMDEVLGSDLRKNPSQMEDTCHVPDLR
ncbi:hypothetical protein F2Q70_00029611 [Brassica cretica]|uniref:Chromo domain-containing protein n=1 Tax=Brassica cretica TaxID=69181 RepID=A0A8S9FK77_BRACR|nr:hypothetical protein F2Q70_00029611 [Brassica cretica]